MSKLTPKLVKEIKSVPEAIQREVFDFLVFLMIPRTNSLLCPTKRSLARTRRRHHPAKLNLLQTAEPARRSDRQNLCPTLLSPDVLANLLP